MVVKIASTSNQAAVQFQIAYGNKNGGGGVQFDAAVPNTSPTSTIYGQYRSLVLEDEIDTSSGDMIAKSDNLPNVTSEFDAYICWMAQEPLQQRKKYLIKHTTNKVRVTCT